MRRCCIEKVPQETSREFHARPKASSPDKVLAGIMLGKFWQHTLLRQVPTLLQTNSYEYADDPLDLKDVA